MLSTVEMELKTVGTVPGGSITENYVVEYIPAYYLMKQGM